MSERPSRRVLSSYKNACQQVCGAINARSRLMGRVVILQPESFKHAKIRQDKHKDYRRVKVSATGGAWRRQVKQCVNLVRLRGALTPMTPIPSADDDSTTAASRRAEVRHTGAPHVSVYPVGAGSRGGGTDAASDLGFRHSLGGGSGEASGV